MLCIIVFNNYSLLLARRSTREQVLGSKYLHASKVLGTLNTAGNKTNNYPYSQSLHSNAGTAGNQYILLASSMLREEMGCAVFIYTG